VPYKQNAVVRETIVAINVLFSNDIELNCLESNLHLKFEQETCSARILITFSVEKLYCLYVDMTKFFFAG